MADGKGSKGFATRWGLIMSLVGASVGTGNIWRFPRMAALNGGGSFILAWTIILVAVSIPIIIGEIVIGRSTRHGTVGAFRDFIGEKYSWMGAFLALVTIGITGYYTAIMGWVMRYFFMAIGKTYYGVDTEALFNSVSSGSIATVICFIASLLITYFIVVKGIRNGIESVNKFMVPTLFVLLMIIAVRAVTLPNASKGLEYMFHIDINYLLSGTTWLNALSQSAWSVGAGWGLVLTYGVYTKSKSDVALNEFVQGFGDNSAALLAGFVVLPTLFALSSSVEQATQICQSGNTGLTFISLTNLFPQMPGGYILGILFFVALYFAALTSNIVMFLTGVTPLIDAGWSRKKASRTILAICFVWGLPSAWNVHFQSNQDWVLGMLLLVGMLFVCFAMFKFGIDKIRDKFINIPENELYVGKWWKWCILVIAPVMIIVMFVWWTLQAISWYPDKWWNPLLESSVGTFVAQGVIFIVLLILFNKKLSNSVKHKYFDGQSYPPIPDEHAN